MDQDPSRGSQLLKERYQFNQVDSNQDTRDDEVDRPNRVLFPGAHQEKGY